MDFTVADIVGMCIIGYLMELWKTMFAGCGRVPLQVQSSAGSSCAAGIIYLPNAVLEVAPGTDQHTLETVLPALKSICQAISLSAKRFTLSVTLLYSLQILSVRIGCTYIVLVLQIFCLFRYWVIHVNEHNLAKM